MRRWRCRPVGRSARASVRGALDSYAVYADVAILHRRVRWKVGSKTHRVSTLAIRYVTYGIRFAGADICAGLAIGILMADLDVGVVVAGDGHIFHRAFLWEVRLGAGLFVRWALHAARPTFVRRASFRLSVILRVSWCFWW